MAGEHDWIDLSSDLAHLEAKAPDYVRRCIRGWLKDKSQATKLEHAVIYDPIHRRIWAGTNARPDAVDFPPQHHDRLNQAGLDLEVWHNHPDTGGQRGSYGPSLDDLSMLIARGTRTVGVVNERGRWSATTVTSREQLSWRGWQSWLTDVDDAIATLALKTMTQSGTVDWNPDEALMRCAQASGIVTVAASHEQVHVGAIRAILAEPAVSAQGNPFERSERLPDSATLVAKLTAHRESVKTLHDARLRHAPSGAAPGW